MYAHIYSTHIHTHRHRHTHTCVTLMHINMNCIKCHVTCTAITSSTNDYGKTMYAFYCDLSGTLSRERSSISVAVFWHINASPNRIRTMLPAQCVYVCERQTPA